MPPNDAVERFKEAFAIYTNPGAPHEPPSPAKKTIASVLNIVSQSKLVKARPRRIQPEGTQSKGWVSALKFTAFLLVFLVPLLALQVAAWSERDVTDWILVVGYLYAAAIGIGVLISSILQGFRYFFLVFILPFCALAVMLRQPVAGGVLFLISQVYGMYFIFGRMRSPAFKALVAAYLIAVIIAGPLLMGNASFVGAIYEKSRAMVEDMMELSVPEGEHESPAP